MMDTRCATIILFIIASADWATCSRQSSILKFHQHDTHVDDHRHRSASATAAPSAVVNVELDRQTGSYSVFVNKRRWLMGSPTFLTVNGQVLSANDGGGLSLIGLRQDDGIDNLGEWRSTVMVYGPTTGTSEAGNRMETVFKYYKHLPNVYLFGQRFPSGVKGSSLGNKNAVSTGFPSFIRTSNSSPTEPRLGYVAYGGIMVGDTEKRLGVWNVSGIKDIVSGLDSGPLILFAEDSSTSIVISTFYGFMSASVEYQLTADGKSAIASWGAIGTATEIPPDFSLWTVIVASEHGINRVMSEWGELMRFNYRRGTEYRDSDITNNYIGYYTDNGAYYYYITEPGVSYEKTMIGVRHYADQLNLPYRYIQYDSWWYYKGPDEGVKEWSAMPAIFPDGMQYAWNMTSWISVAHNRWWSNTTVYAKQNGGKYNFIVEEKSQKALPLDQQFWHDLFTESRKWGLIVYEQDWLNKQFDEMEATVTRLGLGRDWLMQMGQAARDTGLTVQYCMSPSRHALQTLEIPVVSQIRVSNDYQPGNDQWKIGISSMLAHSLGVAPFKDNFWTTTHQPGNKYNLSEPYPELQSIVATLSTGPVAPADRINHTNAALVMRSCNADGLILKPSKPATAIDLQMRLAAFEGFSGQVWSTFSDISGWRFGIIFAADFAHGEKVVVSPQEAGFDFQLPWTAVVFSWFDESRKVAPFSSYFPLKLSNCTTSKFCHYLISPVIHVGSEEFVIYGELDKWVPVSPQRINRIATVRSRDSSGEFADVEVHLRGGPYEKVIFSVGRRNERLVDVSCVMSTDGVATLSIVRAACD